MARGWTPEEVERLRGLKAQGLPLREIARRLDRSFSAVERKLLRLRRVNWALGKEHGNWQPSSAMIACRRTVAEAFGFSDRELTGKSRQRDLVLARHAAMYVLRQRFSMSTMCVGQMFEGRDHSTVLNGLANVHHRMQRDPEFHGLVSSLIAGRCGAMQDAHVVVWRNQMLARRIEAHRVYTQQRDRETGELLASEKVWCTQCDARVTNVAASRCSQRFCPFRRAA